MGVKRPPKYKNLNFCSPTSMQFTKTIHNRYRMSLTGHRKYDLKTSPLCAFFVWTLSFSAKIPQNESLKVLWKSLPPLKIDETWPDGTTCRDTQTGERFLCYQFICGRGLGLKVKNALFGHFGGPHPSPNYFSDPKPKFLALYFRDASKGTTRDPLGPGIRVAKIRGAKQSV
jgi:hypothetical protein